MIGEIVGQHETLTAENKTLKEQVTELEQLLTTATADKEKAEADAATALDMASQTEARLKDVGVMTSVEVREKLANAESLTTEALEQMDGAEKRVRNATDRIQRIMTGAKARGEENIKLRRIHTEDHLPKLQTIVQTMGELGNVLLSGVADFTKVSALLVSNDAAPALKAADSAQERRMAIVRLDGWLDAATQELESLMQLGRTLQRNLKKATNGHVSKLQEQRDATKEAQTNMQECITCVEIERTRLDTEASMLERYVHACKTVQEGPPAITPVEEFALPAITPFELLEEIEEPKVEVEVATEVEAELEVATEQPEAELQDNPLPTENVQILINGPARVAINLKISRFTVLLVTLHEVKPPSPNGNNLVSTSRIALDALKAGLIDGSEADIRARFEEAQRDAVDRNLLHQKSSGLCTRTGNGVQVEELPWKSSQVLHPKQRDRFQKEFLETSVQKKTRREGTPTTV
ncbi:MAG: hypothetical protein ABIO72_02720 [Patescibacteria group bacterium]